MTTRRSILLVAAVAWLAGTGAFGDVYLSTGGNDGNDGLSVGTPKLTLGAAITVFNTQAAPTTLHIAAGAYTQNSVFNVTPVGTAANAVTIQGEGGTVTLNQSVLKLQGAYTTVKDVVIDEQRMHEACVVILSSAGHATVQNCTLRGCMEQASEHFNPDTSEGNEPEDVAPVQVMAAPDATITGCTFNCGMQPEMWDYAVLLPSAVGSAGNLTVTGCTINAASNTAGIKLLRASNNTQVLNTNFNNLITTMFTLQSVFSGVASGNSDQILIQDCVVDQATAVNGSDGLFKIDESLASNITLRRVTWTYTGLDAAPVTTADGAMAGLIISGGTVANVLCDHLTVNHRCLLYRVGPDGEADYIINIRISMPQLFRSYVTNFEVRDSTLRGGDVMQVKDADVNGMRFINVVSSGRFWMNTGPTTGGSLIQNYLMDGCTWKDNTNPTGADSGIYAFHLNGVNVRFDGFSILNSDLRHTQGRHCITFYTAGGVVNNVHIVNSRLEANSVAFFILSTTTTHLDIRNSTLGGGLGCILVQQQAGYPPIVQDLTVAGCTLRNSTLTQERATIYAQEGNGEQYMGCLNTRNDNIRIDGVTIENTIMAGLRGITFTGNGLKSNFQLSNVVATTTLECILTRTGSAAVAAQPSPQSNFTFNNCSFTSLTRHGLDAEGGSTWNNVNFQNCSFTGGTGTQCGGFFMETAAQINNATFNGCQFATASTDDDATQKRTAGMLIEDENTTLSGAGFNNCTFSGRNVALAWQRFQIQNGPGLEPVINNVLVQDCTMLAATDRAMSLQYLEGSNVVFQNIAIQGVPARAIHAEINGNGWKFVNVSYDGGGTRQGVFIASTLNFESANWLMRGCSFTNLAGIGLQIRNALKTSVFENNTLTGAAGSSHGIFVDNSLATAPGAKQAVSLTFRNNNISGFGGDGLRVNGSSHTIRDCTVTSVGGDGVHLLDDNALRAVNASVQCVTNTIADCVGAGIVVEGQNHNVSYNAVLRDAQGIRVRSGVLRAPNTTSTKNNTIKGNCIYGQSIPSGTGLWESINTALSGDPGPNTNTYLNNTVTDWAQGSEFLGTGNRIQNNIFFFNTGTGLRILASGLSGLQAGWNCSPRVSGNQFDGIYIDYSKDIWYNPGFASRTPGDPDFYKLGPLSGCLDRGTTNGLVADGHTDLGCRESGVSEVATWRLY